MPGNGKAAKVEGVGEWIRTLLRKARMNVSALSRESGVSRETLYRALREDEISRATAAQIAEALGVTEQALLNPPASDVRGSRHTGEGSNGAGSGGQSAVVPLRRHAVRVWLREFELEMARAGATDDEISDARTLLTRPEALTFYVGGHTRDATEEETIMGMEAMAEFIRDQLKKAGRKFT